MSAHTSSYQSLPIGVPLVGDSQMMHGGPSNGTQVSDADPIELHVQGECGAVRVRRRVKTQSGGYKLFI